MFYQLLYRLSKNQTYLRRICPYNVELLFTDGVVLSHQQKKTTCIFLDFLRAMIEFNQLSIANNQLNIYQVQYTKMNFDMFAKLVKNQHKEKHPFLHFLLNKIKDFQKLDRLINQFDTQKLAKLYQDAL